MKLFSLTFLILFGLLGCNGKVNVPLGNVGTGNGNTPVEANGPDILADQAWHLKNTGQKSFSSGAGLSGQDLNILDVTNLGYTGSGIKIAISDTGIDLSHPDLNDNQIVGAHRNYSTTDSTSWKGVSVSPYPIELNGHGTAVTGLADAEGFNRIGSRGVAYGARYAGFLFIGNFADTNASTEAKTLDQLWGNFDIFNYSYGFLGCYFVPVADSIRDGYRAGVKNLRGGKGAIYVKAAGNDYLGDNSECDSTNNTTYLGNTNTSGDQNIPYVIIAAAMNANGNISSYSTPGSGVWVASAGGEFGTTKPAMISTDILGCNDGLSKSSSTANTFNKGTDSLNPNCDYTSIMNGTSSATPVLSGVVALMLSANPSLSWRDVKHILAMTAQKVNYSTAAMPNPVGSSVAMSSHVYDYYYTLNNANVSFSNTYGFGRVDALAALQMARTYTSALGSYEETENPNENNIWYYSAGSISLPIPDENPAGVTSNLSVLHNYVIESVQIKISTDHTYIGDLGIELVAPSGTRSKLFLVNNNIKESGLTNFTFLTNAFYGEKSLGSWQINIIDGTPVDTGNLTAWSIKINGHKVTPTTDTTVPSAVTNLTYAATTTSLTASPVINFTNSISGDVVRYEVAVGSSATGEDKAKWYSIGNTNTFQVINKNFTSGQSYYFRVRAIDSSENISTSASGMWTAGI
jgi:subtilisin-like proprotein convertase family protein